MFIQGKNWYMKKEDAQMELLRQVIIIFISSWAL